MRQYLSWGIVAGLIAGITSHVYLFAVGDATWPELYQFIASAIVGRAAFTAVAYVWPGILLHIVISAAWGALYGLAVRWWLVLRTRFIVSGLCYGVIVLAGMQAVLKLDGIPTRMSASLLTRELVGHAVFFGLPLALVLRLAVPVGPPAVGGAPPETRAVPPTLPIS